MGCSSKSFVHLDAFCALCFKQTIYFEHVTCQEYPCFNQKTFSRTFSRNKIGSRTCRKFMTQELLSNHLGRWKCWKIALREFVEQMPPSKRQRWDEQQLKQGWKTIGSRCKGAWQLWRTVGFVVYFFECFCFFLIFPARLGIALWGVSQGSLMTISAKLIWWQVSTHQIEAIHTNVQQPYMDRDLGIYIYIYYIYIYKFTINRYEYIYIYVYIYIK